MPTMAIEANMKKAVTLLALIVSFAVTAQTNNPPPDFRMVNGQIYNVNKSPQWITITIPAGSKVEGEVREYIHVVEPQNVFFRFPNGPDDVLIKNFPFNPANFHKWQNILYLSRPLHLKVFSLSRPTTNYDTFGHITITPAKPQFDFGIPTNSIE